MARVRRRYTTVDGEKDWIVSVTYDEAALAKAHWFEAQVTVVREETGEALALPKELAVYRIGEIEHPFKEIVRLDFSGDAEAAYAHLLNTIYRRIYSYIERGH